MKRFISISVLFAASSLVFGCAGTQAVRSGALSASRGTIVARGRSVKAIAVGPRVIHAFAGQAGGDLFIAPALTGSDLDCEVSSTDDARHPVRIVPDRSTVLNLDSGEVGCLATSDARPFELLWHATGEGRPQIQVASVSTVR